MPDEEIEGHDLLHIKTFSKKPSVEKCRIKAWKHFDIFLERYWKDIPSFDAIKAEDVNNKLIGQYATYLAYHAKVRNSKTKERTLSYNTYQNYLSRIKMLLIDRLFEDKQVPHALIISIVCV